METTAATTTTAEEYDAADYSDLTDTQNIIMVILTVPSALLSLLGSSVIIYSIWRKRRKIPKQPRQYNDDNDKNSNTPTATTNDMNQRRKYVLVATPVSKPWGPYERILLTLSLLDIIFTLTTTVGQTIWTPRHSAPHRITSLGNDATCQALGFFWQLCLSNFYVSGLLNYYYLRTIVHGWSEARFAKQERYWMAAGFVWYVGTATLGVVMNWYDANEIGVGCWVNNVPTGCGEDDWDTGQACVSVVIAWVFGGIQIVFLFVFVAVSNTLIFCHVRKTMARTQQYSVRRLSVVGHSQRRHALSLDRSGTARHQQQQQQQPRQASGVTTNGPPDTRVQQVAVQCALYVAAFWITSLPTLVLRNLEGFNFQASNEGRIYWILLLQSILAPSVGFFNMLVYFRPRYLRCREKFPEQSRYWAFRRAVSDDYGRMEKLSSNNIIQEQESLSSVPQSSPPQIHELVDDTTTNNHKSSSMEITPVNSIPHAATTNATSNLPLPAQTSENDENETGSSYWKTGIAPVATTVAATCSELDETEKTGIKNLSMEFSLSEQDLEQHKSNTPS